ncbi:MAG: hypothetical protein QXV17_07355 [Candidatus Micrarchaeaceae archaeon]
METNNEVFKKMEKTEQNIIESLKKIVLFTDYLTIRFKRAIISVRGNMYNSEIGFIGEDIVIDILEKNFVINFYWKDIKYIQYRDGLKLKIIWFKG